MRKGVFKGSVLCLMMILAFPFLLFAGEQEQDPLKLPIVYTVPGMDAVQVKRDLVYKSVDGVDLTSNVYLPPAIDGKERLPGIVFVHGGPLEPNQQPKPTEWTFFDSYGRLSAAQDMIGITFNHRLHSWNDLDQSTSDITSIMEFIRNRAAEFHLDPDRLTVWVFSGGGPLSSYFLRENPAYLKAIVMYYAALDLSESQRITKEIGKELVDRYSPVRYIDGENYNGAPMFIARAGKDSPAINRSVETMFRKAMASGVVFELMNHPKGQHGFDILNDDDRSQEIIARTFEFIKARMNVE